MNEVIKAKKTYTVDSEILEAAIVDQLGLSRRDAKLAVRVWLGDSNSKLATSTATALSTIKSRLFRVYRAIGAKNRVEFARTITLAAVEAGVLQGVQ